MSKPTHPYWLSVDDYLQLEAVSSVRHEYVAGQIFAMTGSTRRANLIAGSIFSAIKKHLAGGPCETYVVDVKVRFRINKDEYLYYPDVLVTCEPEESEQHVEHPKLIVEVLSPPTENVDRREKAVVCRAISSLEEYVIIAQDTPEVTVLRRSEQWKPMVHSDLGNIVEFRSIGLSLPLSVIYQYD